MPKNQISGVTHIQADISDLDSLQRAIKSSPHFDGVVYSVGDLFGLKNRSAVNFLCRNLGKYFSQNTKSFIKNSDFYSKNYLGAVNLANSLRQKAGHKDPIASSQNKPVTFVYVSAAISPIGVTLNPMYFETKTRAEKELKEMVWIKPLIVRPGVISTDKVFVRKVLGLVSPTKIDVDLLADFITDEISNDYLSGTVFENSEIHDIMVMRRNKKAINN